MYTFGVKDTIYAFEAGAIETLIVWSELPYIRHNVLNLNTNENEVLIQMEGEDIRGDYQVIEEPVSLIEWIMDIYETYNTQLEIISNSSPEGSQFCHGFSGIGSLLRFTLDLPSQTDFEDLEPDSGEWEW